MVPAGSVAFTVTVKVIVLVVPATTGEVVVRVHKVPATEPTAQELVAPATELYDRRSDLRSYTRVDPDHHDC